MEDKQFEKLQVQPVAGTIVVTKLFNGQLCFHFIINENVAKPSEILNALIDHLNKLGEMQRENSKNRDS